MCHGVTSRTILSVVAPALKVNGWSIKLVTKETHDVDSSPTPCLILIDMRKGSSTRGGYVQPCKPLLYVSPITTTAAEPSRTAGPRVHAWPCLLHDLGPVDLVSDTMMVGQERSHDEPTTRCYDLRELSIVGCRLIVRDSFTEICSKIKNSRSQIILRRPSGNCDNYK